MIFNGRRGWQAGTLVPALLVMFCLIWIYVSYVEMVAEGNLALNIDFRVFWAASKLAYSGSVMSTLDVEQLASVHQVSEEKWMPWIYPPGFLIVLTPLGALNFSTAWLVFTLVSLAASLIAIRPFSGGLVPVWLGFGLAPALLPNLTTGQTSVLWTAGLVGALALLRDNRQVLAGILIGLLTLKPQLGLLIPIALIASGAWRTFFSAAATTILISVLSTMMSGIDYWYRLKALLDQQVVFVRAAIDENDLMISGYSVFAGIGLPEPLALGLQWCLALMAAFAVFVAWRSPKIGFDLRAATLLLGIAMSTPYLWFYEATLIAPAGLFLLRAGVLSESSAGLILAGLMWLGITPAFVVMFFTEFDQIGMRTAFAPLVSAAIVVCIVAITRRLRDPVPTANLT